MPCGSLTTFKYKHINYTAKTLCNYCFNVHTSDLALKVKHIHKQTLKKKAYGLNDKLEMWANAQPDGRPAEYRWRALFNAAKFG